MSQPPMEGDGPLYAALAAGGLMFLTCLASQIGGTGVLVLLMAFGGFALFAGVNYWLWGWRLKNDE